jgi:hypothetical protein
MSEQDPIPEYLEKLAQLQQIIRDVVSYDFEIRESISLGSLPPDILLNSLSDLCLIMAENFDKGTFGSRNNPGLRFVEDTPPRGQELHTLKGIKIHYPSMYYWDPQASDIFRELAIAFIKLKKKQPISAKKVFMTFAEHSDLLKKAPPTKSRKRKRKAQYFWWRRHTRRSRRVARNHNPK